MTAAEHLVHLFKMLAPPFTYHWWPQIKHRAAELAAGREDCAELPMLVEAEYARIKSAASTSSSKSSAAKTSPT